MAAAMEQPEPAAASDTSWSVHRSESGVKYFFDADAARSQWERPAALLAGNVFSSSEDAEVLSWQPAGATECLLVRTQQGSAFFYHRSTDTSTWAMPPEVRSALDAQEDACDDSSGDESDQELGFSAKVQLLQALLRELGVSADTAWRQVEGQAASDPRGQLLSAAVRATTPCAARLPRAASNPLRAPSSGVSAGV